MSETSSKAVREYGEDENILNYIGKGIRERGYLAPQDLLYIICWKAPRSNESRGKASNNAFKCIRERGIEGIRDITKEALELADRGKVKESVGKLTELYGVKTRVASAILTFYDPNRFGVVDRLAWKALYNIKKMSFRPSDYEKFLRDIRELAKKCSLPPRNIDLALWYMEMKTPC